MPTRIDSSPMLTLAICDECPTWSYMAGDRDEAHRACIRHESQVHPGATRAATRARVARHRDTPPLRNVTVQTDPGTNGILGSTSGASAA